MKNDFYVHGESKPMKTTIYANYGVLAHEYQTIYTVTAPHGHAKVSEQVIVEIPDDFKPYHNEAGEVVVNVPGMPWPYMLGEVLAAVDGELPGLRWYDGRKWHRVALEVIDGDRDEVPHD